MFAQVIPAIRLPKSFGAYDYAVPLRYRDLVTPGSWVIVPWRGRPVGGLVTGLSEQTDIDPKRVAEMIGFGDRHPLPPDLWPLAERMARRYLVSPSTALKSFLPTTPKTKVERPEDGEPSTNRPAEKTAPPSDLKNLLVRYTSPEEKRRELIRLIRQTDRSGAGMIVVTPHAPEIDPLTELIKDSTALPVIPVHGGLTSAQLRKNWKRLLTGEPAVVVGTRPAALAPLPRPGLFLALEADSPDLRQYDQNPRYDVRDILSWRAELSGARLAFLSHCPRLDEYRLATQERLVRPAASSPDPETVLVDLSGQSRDWSSPLAPTALDRIGQSLQAGRKVLVFHNRLGSAGGLVCRDCGLVLRCPTCEIALGVSSQALRCSRCGHNQAVPTNCPGCHRENLASIGQGTRTIETALCQQFPERTVRAYDSDLPPERRAVTIEEADLLIGTSLLLHDLSEQDCPAGWGCLVVPRLDDLLAFPGYRVTEQAWRTVRTLKNLAGSTGATLLLQTLDPDSPRLRRLLLNEDDFVRQELQERETAGYPPCGTLLTVTVKHRDEPESARLARELTDRLRSALPDDGSRIAGPLRHRQPHRDGHWRHVVVIRTGEDVPEGIREVLTGLPENFIVDRNPETVG